MSRYLSDKVAKAFAPATRQRGERLAYNAVRVLESSPKYVEADVRGSRMYLVSVTLIDNDLAIDCTCPYYDSYDPCKHIWSLLRAAEDQGLLPAAKHIPLGMVDAQMLGDEDFFGDIDPLRFLSPPPPEWVTALGEMRTVSVDAPRRGLGGWPLGRQAVFILDSEMSGRAGAPVLNIAFRDLKANGQLSKPKQVDLSISQIDLLPDPLEREILSLLCGAERRTGYYTSGFDTVPNSVELPPQLAGMALTRLNGTGRLFQTPLLPLALDEGPVWEPRVAVERSGGEWEVSASLVRGGERIALSDALMIVRGGWILRPGLLGAFPRTVAWRSFAVSTAGRPSEWRTNTLIDS